MTTLRLDAQNDALTTPTSRLRPIAFLLLLGASGLLGGCVSIHNHPTPVVTHAAHASGAVACGGCGQIYYDGVATTYGSPTRPASAIGLCPYAQPSSTNPSYTSVRTEVIDGRQVIYVPVPTGTAQQQPQIIYEQAPPQSTTVVVRMPEQQAQEPSTADRVIDLVGRGIDLVADRSRDRNGSEGNGQDGVDAGDEDNLGGSGEGLSDDDEVICPPTGDRTGTPVVIAADTEPVGPNRSGELSDRPAEDHRASEQYDTRDRSGIQIGQTGPDVERERRSRSTDGMSPEARTGRSRTTTVSTRRRADDVTTRPSTTSTTGTKSRSATTTTTSPTSTPSKGTTTGAVTPTAKKKVEPSTTTTTVPSTPTTPVSAPSTTVTPSPTVPSTTTVPATPSTPISTTPSTTVSPSTVPSAPTTTVVTAPAGD